jgi:delta-aminolevulinic acid dehydratase/porphobilinogen synthase
MGLPIGTAKYMATAEDASIKDGVTTGVIVTYECLEGINKGKSGKVWYSTLHPNPQTANISRQALKRLADATGKAISPSAPIKGRVVTLEVQLQKRDPKYTEIKRYLSPDHVPEEVVPF